MHIQPNNYYSLAEVDNVIIPRLDEFSFLRQDFLKKVSRLDGISIQNKSNFPNVKETKDVISPDIWWKK